jgi:hypothetical protein
LSIFWGRDEIKMKMTAHFNTSLYLHISIITIFFVALAIGPILSIAKITSQDIVWGQKYPWPCTECKNKHCFERCNLNYLEENWGIWSKGGH